MIQFKTQENKILNNAIFKKIIKWYDWRDRKI